MKSAVVLAIAGLVAAAPQAPGTGGAGGALGPAPANCQKSYNGNFEITVVIPSNIPNKRALEERQSDTCGKTGYLTLNLKDGNLMDVDGRTGYIASNNSQLQFDKPVQAGGIYAGQFSVCNNGSIALGPSTQFFQCQSGGMYNLYLNNIAPQCSPVNIDVIPCAGSSAVANSAAPLSVSSDGQPQATAKPTTAPVSVYTDGQPQATAKATSVAPVSVFTDGQPQATAPATSIKPAAVSEYTDGQPQATANATAVAPKPSATIATAGAASMAAPLFLAGAMAFFAML